MFERIIHQFANDTIENHLDVGIIALRAKVGRETDLHVVHRRTLSHEVLDAPRQAEIVEHMRRKVVRNFPQRADRLVDHISRITDDLLLIGRQRLPLQGRQRHTGRREQRPQPVVQILRETRPRFLLGAQHGRQDALVEQLPLAVEPGDVLESLWAYITPIDILIEMTSPNQTNTS